MPYTVLITTEANKDIASIIAYISEACCAPLTAVNLYKEIIGKIRSLELHRCITKAFRYMGRKSIG